MDEDWRETSFFGGWRIWATLEEVEELSNFVLSWLNARRHPDGNVPEDARLVHLTYRALPQEESER